MSKPKKKKGAPKGSRPPANSGCGVDTSVAEKKRVHDAMMVAEEQLAQSVRAQAAEYVTDAVDTLGSFAKGDDVNGIEPAAPTVASAAKTIIEFAGGRPETRDPKTSDPSQQVHIYIQRFGEENDVIEAVNEAAAVAQSVVEKGFSRTYEVPDAPTDQGESS